MRRIVPRSLLATSLSALKLNPWLAASAAVGGVLLGTAFLNRQLARKAQRDNPPTGSFLDIDGVRLHYVERGKGRPLVLFHGNGSMIQDFEASGLIDLAAESYKVIVFDRPGFGHSRRPRNVVWTPAAQADLFAKALKRLGVSHALVLGHSWGASVAVALALQHPRLVEGLILASGYYFPSIRPDFVALSTPAIPGVGDVLSQTLSPLISRLMWPLLIKKMFGPRSVPSKFEAFPKAMAVRPSQIRASAAEVSAYDPERRLYQRRVCEAENAGRYHCR